MKIEHFMAMPNPDYPTKDNILIVRESDKCIWTIDRTKSQDEILENQKNNTHCHQRGFDIIKKTESTKLYTPPPLSTPQSEPAFVSPPQPPKTVKLAPDPPPTPPQPPEPPPPPKVVCDKNKEWTQCSLKCSPGVGVKRRYTDDCGIEEVNCSYNFKVTVWSDPQYRGQSRDLTCSDFEIIANDDPSWFAFRMFRPFGVESYKWGDWDKENIEHIHMEWNNWGDLVHKGDHAKDFEGLKRYDHRRRAEVFVYDPDVSHIMIYVKMKGDGLFNRVTK